MAAINIKPEHVVARTGFRLYPSENYLKVLAASKRWQESGYSTDYFPVALYNDRTSDDPQPIIVEAK